MSQKELYVSLSKKIDWNKVQGLVPAIVQHEQSGQVLMLGYMDNEALEQSIQTQKVTFWSRTKARLWTKGESSGHFLILKSIQLDCDKDTLLIQAISQGPTCHLGYDHCFNDLFYPNINQENLSSNLPSLVFLHHLETILAQRKNAMPDSSYTASLFAQGTKRISQKVGEEGVEVALAATCGDKKELLNESADLLYHLLVLLQDKNSSLQEVIHVLKQRHQS